MPFTVQDLPVPGTIYIYIYLGEVSSQKGSDLLSRYVHVGNGRLQPSILGVLPEPCTI